MPSSRRLVGPLLTSVALGAGIIGAHDHILASGSFPERVNHAWGVPQESVTRVAGEAFAHSNPIVAALDGDSDWRYPVNIDSHGNLISDEFDLGQDFVTAQTSPRGDLVVALSGNLAFPKGHGTAARLLVKHLATGEVVGAKLGEVSMPRTMGIDSDRAYFSPDQSRVAFQLVVEGPPVQPGAILVISTVDGAASIVSTGNALLGWSGPGTLLTQVSGRARPSWEALDLSTAKGLTLSPDLMSDVQPGRYDVSPDGTVVLVPTTVTGGQATSWRLLSSSTGGTITDFIQEGAPVGWDGDSPLFRSWADGDIRGVGMREPLVAVDPDVLITRLFLGDRTRSDSLLGTHDAWWTWWWRELGAGSALGLGVFLVHQRKSPRPIQDQVNSSDVGGMEPPQRPIISASPELPERHISES